MRTDDFVVLLANGAGTVESHSISHRFSTAILASLMVSVVLMFATLGLLPDLALAFVLPKFWMKVAFSGSLAIAGFLAMIRLSRPGTRLGLVPAGIVLPIAVIWAVIGLVLANADPVDRLGLLLGQTWMVCPFLIAMLSMPVFIAMFWALQDLAPTRLSLAGAAAGLFSGAVGALVYTLHCPEMEPPFIGTWYLLGISIPTIIGALSGPRLLRW